MHLLLASLGAFVNLWLLGVAFFLLIFGGFASGTLRAVQSRRWPSTKGKVVETSIRVNTSSSSDTSSSLSETYEPVVRYSYEAEGRPQESKQVRIGVISGSRHYAESVLAKYPEGAEVTVYHHPKLTHLAVLEPGHFILPAVATVISGAVLYLVVGGWLAHSLHPKTGPWQHAHPPATEQ